MSCSSARGTGPVESGGPSSSSPLLFFPFLLLPFTGEPGPRGSASSSSLLHSSPSMDLGSGARSGTAWRGLLGGGDDGGLVVWFDTMAGRGRGGDGNRDSMRARSRVTGELGPRRRAGAKVRPGWTALGSADLEGDGGVVKAQALMARRAGCTARRAGCSRTRGASVLRARAGDTAAGLRRGRTRRGLNHGRHGMARRGPGKAQVDASVGVCARGVVSVCAQLDARSALGKMP